MVIFCSETFSQQVPKHSTAILNKFEKGVVNKLKIDFLQYFVRFIFHTRLYELFCIVPALKNKLVLKWW